MADLDHLEVPNPSWSSALPWIELNIADAIIEKVIEDKLLPFPLDTVKIRGFEEDWRVVPDPQGLYLDEKRARVRVDLREKDGKRVRGLPYEVFFLSVWAMEVFRGGRIKPDYNLTINEVYLGTARAILETSRNLDLFSAVPDWSSRRSLRKSHPLGLGDFGLAPNNVDPGFHLYNTSYDRTSPIDFRFSSDLGIAAIQGVYVDKIAKVGSYCDSKENFTESANQWRQIFEPISDERYVVEGINTIEAFWRTMFADQYYGQNPHPTNQAHHIHRLSTNLPGIVNFPPRDLQQEEKLKVELSASPENLGFIPGRFSIGRCFFITKRGYLGLSPHHTHEGDVVATLWVEWYHSCSEMEQIYSLVGESYICNVIDREIILKHRRGEVGLQEFLIV